MVGNVETGMSWKSGNPRVGLPSIRSQTSKDSLDLALQNRLILHTDLLKSEVFRSASSRKVLDVALSHFGVDVMKHELCQYL
jgi:hypothetical protein